MIITKSGHIDHIKQNNVGVVYELIDRHGSISRIELSKLSQLAPASITKITRELLQAQIITEVEFNQNLILSRGRPAVGLQISRLGWQFISIRLFQDHVFIALHQIDGLGLIEERYPLECRSQNDLLNELFGLIRLFSDKYNDTIEKVCAIAVTVSGLVNQMSGNVIQMPSTQINDLPLKDFLANEMGLPIFIGNDIRSWALAEKYFGNAKQANNAILVAADQTVGTGIILDGHVLEGQIGNIGELGHIQIKSFGKRCFCGNNGCLDTVASVGAVLSEAKTLLAQGYASRLTLETLSVQSLCDAANYGDGLATKVLREFGHHLGHAIAIMVNLFNPDTVMIGGEFNRAKSVVFPAIIECVRSQTLPHYFENLTFEETLFFSQRTMPGAALVKRAMYSGDLLIKMLNG